MVEVIFLWWYIIPELLTHVPALFKCSLWVKKIACQGLLPFHTKTSTFPFQRSVEALFVLDVKFLLKSNGIEGREQKLNK